jgi:hypothetical protein
LIERIEPIQRLEAQISQISEAIRTGFRKALRAKLVQSHGSRERIVPELPAIIYESGTRI